MSLSRIDGIGFAMVAGVAGLLYVAGVRPLQEAHAETVKLRAELWVANSKLGERKLTEEKATSTAKQLSDRLESLDIQLSSIEMMNKRLSDLTQLTEKSGVIIEGLRPGASTSQEKYRAVTITLAGRCSYLQAVDFLDRLRDTFPDTGMQGIAFDRLQDAADQGRLQVTMVWYAAPSGRSGPAASANPADRPASGGN